MSKKLRVGVIGLGGIANTHVPGWNSSPYTELVAGSDINPAAFPVWEQKYGLKRFYQNPEELIQDPEIDIVDICSPNVPHPAGDAAAERWQARYCEKPLAPTRLRSPDDRGARPFWQAAETAQHFASRVHHRR